jgi:tRNA(fMet)-specific endonuclease VapC
MLILDTDHLSVLDRGGRDLNELQNRLEPRHAEVCTTIVSISEQLRGLLAQIKSARDDTQLQDRYDRLSRRLDRMAEFRIIGWTAEAGSQFAQLRRRGVRIGTMDLRIASIALAHDATLLTRNLKDFSRVPNLRVENWLE